MATKKTKVEFTAVRKTVADLDDLLRDLSYDDLIGLVDTAKAIEFFEKTKADWVDYGFDTEPEITMVVK